MDKRIPISILWMLLLLAVSGRVHAQSIPDWARPDECHKIQEPSEEDLPEPKTLLTGKILDKKTLMEVPFATVYLFGMENEWDLMPLDTFRTDQTGEFRFEILPGRAYTLLGDAPEYQPELVPVHNPGAIREFRQDLSMQSGPIEICGGSTLNNLYWDLGSSDLREESKATLNQLAGILEKNSTIHVQMTSFLSETENDHFLANKRSENAISFLRSQISRSEQVEIVQPPENRLLIYPEKNDPDGQLNRRTEFRLYQIDQRNK